MNWLPGDALVVLGVRLDGQQPVDGGPLDERGHEGRVDEVDRRVGAGEEVVGDEARQRQDVRERRPVAEAVERGRDRDPRAAHRRVALAADGHDA